MNHWECDDEDCTVVAEGTGGAMGLVAIGWYFRPGMLDVHNNMLKRFQLYCPRHYPMKGRKEIEKEVESMQDMLAFRHLSSEDYKRYHWPSRIEEKDLME